MEQCYTLIDKLVTCNSPQWDDKMYFIMQINLFFFQPVDCHYSSLTGLQNVSTFNKLNTVLIPYHTSILNSVTELKSTVKVGLSSTGWSRKLYELKTYIGPLHFTRPSTGGTQPHTFWFWVGGADDTAWNMLLRPENNAVMYFAFQFSAETKQNKKKKKGRNKKHVPCKQTFVLCSRKVVSHIPNLQSHPEGWR